MTDDSITKVLVKSLRDTLRRFVRKVNDDGIGTGTEAPISDSQVREILTRSRPELGNF